MKKLAIAVGVDTYRSAPLAYCVADADAVATALEMPEYGYSVVQLFDDNATRIAILEALGNALDAQPDQFLFYFSGHGAVTPVGAYLVTHDGRPYDEGIDLGVLSRYMERLAEVTAQVVAILDCCHSGAALPWAQTRFVHSADIEQGISTLTDTRVVIAACRAEEFSLEESELKHGLFTYHLLEGLTGGAVDFNGAVTVGSLYEYVRPAVTRVAAQQPILRGDVGGRVVLGTGFPQRVGAPIPGEVRESLLAEGRELLDEYARLAGRAQARWKESGHRECSQNLTSIVRWFDTKSGQHPELANDLKFQQLRQEVTTRVSQLGSMDSGTRVGRGVLAAKLGSGGFGSVWRVDSLDDTGSTALKVFHPADFGERDKLELFHRGFRAMSRLDHPRVVSVYEFTRAPIGFYMYFIDGPNLRQVPELITDPASLLRVLILAAETIQHAHGRGVIHRDIKPENILLSYDDGTQAWWPYLTDFDLAWFSTATSVTEKSFGNLYYASPEQLAKPHSNAARSIAVDVYSFGQLAFFVLTGSNPTPFARDLNVAVLRDRIGRWSSGVSAQKVLNWYERAVRDDPRERYPDFQPLISDLAAAEVAMRAQDLELHLERTVFLREVAFGLSGFAAEGIEEGQLIRSVSGRTQMRFWITEAPSDRDLPQVVLTAILTLDTLEMQGVSTERAKGLLMSRVNQIVGPISNISRKSRAEGAFSVEVVFSPVESNYPGVLFVREVLGRVVDSLER